MNVRALLAQNAREGGMWWPCRPVLGTWLGAFAYGWKGPHKVFS